MASSRLASPKADQVRTSTSGSGGATTSRVPGTRRLEQRLAVQRAAQANRDRVPKRLRGVAGTFRMRDQLSHRIARRTADEGEFDADLFEVSRGIIDVILFGIPESRPYVGGGILDGNLVERREPRHLGQQSKGGAHHDVLEG